MPTVLLQVAYDGTGYCGWARQRDSESIEDKVQAAVHALDPNASRVRGSSRTDAGVHADCQLVAFDTEKIIGARGWVLGTNRHLPDDIAIRQASLVEDGFTPRFAAKWKRYRYRLYAGRIRHPRFERTHWHVRFLLDRSRMRAAAELLLGEHDFAAFRTTMDERTSTVRTIFRADVEENGDEIAIVIEGSGFLHNMVRIIVGTLMDVGRGKLPADVVTEAIRTGDRRVLGTTAPAHGLCLEWTELERLSREATGDDTARGVVVEEERWP